MKTPFDNIGYWLSINPSLKVFYGDDKKLLAWLINASRSDSINSFGFNCTNSAITFFNCYDFGENGSLMSIFESQLKVFSA